MGLSDSFSNTAPQKSPRVAGTLNPIVQTYYDLIQAENVSVTAGAIDDATFDVGLSGSKVAVIGQSDPTENGLYTINVNGGADRVSGLTVPSKIIPTGGGSNGYVYFKTAGSNGYPIYGPFGQTATAPTAKTPSLASAFDNTAPDPITP